MDATVIVHWPGQSTPACEEHAAQLNGLAEAMGFTLAATPVVEPVECENCAKHQGIEETKCEPS